MINRIFKLFLVILFVASPYLIGQDTLPSVGSETEQVGPLDQPFSYRASFIKMMLTLFALIVLIVVSVWMLRRLSRGRMKQMNYGKQIKIIERRPISAKSILYLVEIGGKRVVISESQFEVRAITTLDQLVGETED